MKFYYAKDFKPWWNNEDSDYPESHISTFSDIKWIEMKNPAIEWKEPMDLLSCVWSSDNIQHYIKVVYALNNSTIEKYFYFVDVNNTSGNGGEINKGDFVAFTCAYVLDNYMSYFHALKKKMEDNNVEVKFINKFYSRKDFRTYENAPWFAKLNSEVVPTKVKIDSFEDQALKRSYFETRDIWKATINNNTDESDYDSHEFKFFEGSRAPENNVGTGYGPYVIKAVEIDAYCLWNNTFYYLVAKASSILHSDKITIDDNRPRPEHFNNQSYVYIPIPKPFPNRIGDDPTLTNYNGWEHDASFNLSTLRGVTADFTDGTTEPVNPNKLNFNCLSAGNTVTIVKSDIPPSILFLNAQRLSTDNFKETATIAGQTNVNIAKTQNWNLWMAKTNHGVNWFFNQWVANSNRPITDRVYFCTFPIDKAIEFNLIDSINTTGSNDSKSTMFSLCSRLRSDQINKKWTVDPVLFNFIEERFYFKDTTLSIFPSMFNHFQMPNQLTIKVLATIDYTSTVGMIVGETSYEGYGGRNFKKTLKKINTNSVSYQRDRNYMTRTEINGRVGLLTPAISSFLDNNLNTLLSSKQNMNDEIAMAQRNQRIAEAAQIVDAFSQLGTSMFTFGATTAIGNTLPIVSSAIGVNKAVAGGIMAGVNIANQRKNLATQIAMSIRNYETQTKNIASAPSNSSGSVFFDSVIANENVWKTNGSTGTLNSRLFQHDCFFIKDEDYKRILNELKLNGYAYSSIDEFNSYRNRVKNNVIRIDPLYNYGYIKSVLLKNTDNNYVNSTTHIDNFLNWLGSRIRRFYKANEISDPTGDDNYEVDFD